MRVGIPVQFPPDIVNDVTDPLVILLVTVGSGAQTLPVLFTVTTGAVVYPEPLEVIVWPHVAGLRVAVAVVPEPPGAAIVRVGMPVQVPGDVTLMPVMVPLTLPVVPTVAVTTGSTLQTLLVSTTVTVGAVVVEYPVPALAITAVKVAGLRVAVAVADHPEVIL